MNKQRTLKTSVQFSGVGLHTGRHVEVELRPAAANSGIVFCREDLPGKPFIKASPLNVFDTRLATLLGTPEVHVSTIEHLMAALFGFGIDNAVIGINSFEMPIVDGSAAPFLVLLDEAGVQELEEERKILKIRQVVEVVDPLDPSRFIRIEPSKQPLISYSIDYEKAQAIGKQCVTFDLTGKTVCEELSFARTFCLEEEVDFMRSKGLAQGGTLENAIVVSGKNGVLNRQGLRSSTEFVRHKVLDCIGDLALIGMPLIGHVIAHKAGHDLHTALGKKILGELAAHEILLPRAREAALLKALLDFPKSLAGLRTSLATGLAIG